MFGLPGQWEWLLILMLGVLLYGRRLPEVGRTLGRTVTEFKRGLSEAVDQPARSPSRPGSLPLAPPPAVPVAGAPAPNRAAPRDDHWSSPAETKDHA